ncbi:hypothetical protein [Cognatiyoonia sp. IB215182]|uniref:hypothetical protein n=1 Tax=Cognatiyoonia sp. IB215182 TaxID=3097353 RepID=UPI002A24A54C|nr:hypothetical protein [Cognatiyoonia sp. IB215182]
MLGSHAMAKLFCLFMMVIGIGAAGWHSGSVITGLRLELTGQLVQARIIDKHIDRPTRGNSVRIESVRVNNKEVRSARSYLNDYLLTVSYTIDGATNTALAPVGYDRWHEESVGSVVAAKALPNVSNYVEATSFGVFILGLKQVAIGLAIFIVGFISFRLQGDD